VFHVAERNAERETLHLGLMGREMTGPPGPTHYQSVPVALTRLTLLTTHFELNQGQIFFLLKNHVLNSLQIYTLAANGVSGKPLGSKGWHLSNRNQWGFLQQKMQKKTYGQLRCRQGQTRFFFKTLPSLSFSKKIKKVLCVSLHHFLIACLRVNWLLLSCLKKIQADYMYFLHVFNSLKELSSNQLGMETCTKSNLKILYVSQKESLLARPVIPA
jgi:hypothetical protein